MVAAEATTVMPAAVTEEENAEITISSPPTEVLQLWTEVGNGIDKNQTVVWKSAVESLGSALKYLKTPDARVFVEKYAGSIIGILAEQSPSKIGPHERSCVQDSLLTGVCLVAADLEIQNAKPASAAENDDTSSSRHCKLVDTVLAQVFSKKKNFYKGKSAWQQNVMTGFPEVRLRNIDKFRSVGGFQALATYLRTTKTFPKLDSLHHILTAVSDSLQETEAVELANIVMEYMNAQTDFKGTIPPELLAVLIRDLERIFDRLVVTRRDATVEFYAFWRALVLRLITSPSLPLKLFGWEQVGELIKACAEHRPPPRAFVVTGAGCAYANGEYQYAGPMTPDGYAKPGGEVSYVHEIPPDDPNGGAGKKLTLFRCTMRSAQKWWFLSEADEEQPGTDRDIDYYQHKSKEHEEAFPPPENWITCRNAGVHPPPTVAPKGVLVPPGEENNTLEHELAQWAIENEIVEQVLGDTTIHREVVARSTVLIKFLASMCHQHRDDNCSTGSTDPDPMDADEQQQQQQPPPPPNNKYCLRASHLLFAWKTCLRKADAAVSLQVYQLLVSILPDCPSNLAIPLLRAVQTSLHESSEKRDYLFEVSEFCSALASANLVEANNNTRAAALAGATLLSEDVREEVLNLLWSVLTHPGVSSLKSYDSLKRYVTHELRVEPKGSEHRERFLQSCITTLSTNAENKAELIDEMQALRMVKLTRFILEACPRPQADAMVIANNAALPLLLFNELVAHLQRRQQQQKKRPIGHSRKPSLTMSSGSLVGVAAAAAPSLKNADALEERLRILRYVYGLSDPAVVPDPITMTAAMVDTLWNLCVDKSEDREALMVFIASASHPGRAALYDRFGAFVTPTVNAPGVQVEPLLSPAFTEEVCQSIFLNLFCSLSFNYDQLGEDGYRSFQFLFKRLRESPCSSGSKKIALDALWKVCLTAGKDSVASQAMKDLLSVYVSFQTAIVAPQSMQNGQVSDAAEQMVTDEIEESFGDRMFQCLERVKIDLEAGVPSAERSVERCVWILNAAIGRVDAEGLTTSSTLARLAALPSSNTSLSEAMHCLPFGMRGQACYRRIGILAKRPQLQNQSVNYDNASPRPQSTFKFSLDVHPLETLSSIKYRVALTCQCTVQAVKPIQINGRAKSTTNEPHMSLNLVPEDSVVDELGIVRGCEVVFVIAERMQNNTAGPAATTQRGAFSNDLSSVFFSDDGKFADRLFSMVLGILEALPWKETEEKSETDSKTQSTDIHKLVWDLLLAMPMNESVALRVRSAQRRSTDSSSISSADDPMEVEASGEGWAQLLDSRNFDRSVYVLLTIDAFLQPAPEALSILPPDQKSTLEKKMLEDANSFRRAFIDAGGFSAVAKFFSSAGGDAKTKQVKTRRGNAVALRILKSCLFGNIQQSQGPADSVSPDETGIQLLQSLSDSRGLLKSLTAMVVEDLGISSSTITDVLRFLRLLFQSPGAARSFVALPDAEKFLVILLMWVEEPDGPRSSSSISAAMHVRRGVHDLILQTPVLADAALPWLVKAIDKVDVTSESTSEYFDVLERLLSDARSKNASDAELRDLGRVVCKKLSSCPRPVNETDLNDVSTGVLCGCLRLLRALIEHGGGGAVKEGSKILLAELGIDRWSSMSNMSSRSMFSMMSSPFTARNQAEDAALVDLMGAIFDGFLTPGGSSSVAICCDKESRRRGFDVVGAAAKACKGAQGYMALVTRIDGLISSAAPTLRHRFGHFGGGGATGSRSRVSSKYSGLRNQGCTCYMNSVLQQLFMMPQLRNSMCSAPLPAALRTVGSGLSAKGAELVGKKISLQWDTGVAYDAIVESFDPKTEMHSIRYCPIQIAVGGNVHQQVMPEDVARLPPSLPDEFVLSEGRPGKETGVFEIVPEPTAIGSGDAKEGESSSKSIQESEDEALSRHLLEEVQRTFIHLEEGSRGHCFDPRALVEACACLKLEFDVWQQNDASEFATKLLDRLEISLKKWAPTHFQHMDHTFGLKQTKQKICKKCGLKSNREEKLLNIDCQIRGKSDIHEALAAMTEVEIMEGSNQVYCDSCKENTDTILKSAISTLPNMLILSLKRFDLDYNTFETVKLNSRCAFGQTLNMKQYSLDAVEALEQAEKSEETGDASPMETEEGHAKTVSDPLENLPDEDYEYRLVGVLVHAGVAQGGHYYSFIKDRFTGTEEKWYRFDDEDVTPFDPASIETECFGGKVKKETKWPNGQVQTLEQEQFANALMLFYEKVKPSDLPPEVASKSKDEGPSFQSHQSAVATMSGYDVFEPDVRKANAIHQWQSFLFDTEFQAFLNELLGFCGRFNDRASDQEKDDSWRAPVIQMLLTFVFDVMLYSSDLSSLRDWARGLEEILSQDSESAVAFVQKLARKTSAISANWLRTFLIDCPDHMIRDFSVRIFSVAVETASASEDELKALTPWSRAWRDQVTEINTAAQASGNKAGYLPCCLEGSRGALEDKQKIGAGTSSAGVIFSFLNVLLEALPRCWHFSSEIFVFIRNLASMDSGKGDSVLRRPMIDAQIPGRLFALAIRERSPSLLRIAFPGASASVDVANTQMRAETNPTAHVLPNQVLNATDLNNRGPTGTDVRILLETIGCLAGIKGIIQAPLVREADDGVRGRHRYTLTENAMKCLSTIFHENCAPGAPGMGQNEIENYLLRSGVDTANVSTQKIIDMLSKYPTTGSIETERGTFLSLEGFLAYYRDCVQTNELRLCLDLHVFGFRPDLSRRPRETRFFKITDHETMSPPARSVGEDVANMFKERSMELGQLANYALANTVYIYTLAYRFSEPLMQYLAAAATYRKDPEFLIVRTLQSIYQAPNDAWDGGDLVNSAISLLQVIASAPGDDQQTRVKQIMTSNAKAARGVEFGGGLLHVLRALGRMRHSNHYNTHTINHCYGRYLSIVRELNALYPVFNWMNENRNFWSFVERELLDPGNAMPPQNQLRVEYVPREHEDDIQLGHNTHSDSDMGGMHDSEDDDSQYDNLDLGADYESPSHVIVSGAGTPAVNGTYIQDGFHETACRYGMEGAWKGTRYKFYMFLCNVSNNTKHWYISIVPYGGNPGTSSDIDFYTAPMTSESSHIPPQAGWVKANEGKDPVPRLEYRFDDAPDIEGNGNVIEDDNDDAIEGGPYV